MEELHEPSSKNQLRPLIVRWVRELITAVVPALLIALFVNVFIAQAAMVEAGPSMQPNLYKGDRMMTEKVSYYFHAPQRGDVVAIDMPSYDDLSVKRIIALPFERIQIKDYRVYVNGRPLRERYLPKGVWTFSGPISTNTYVVEENCYFVLGDNRKLSVDSRYFGAVSKNCIVGRIAVPEA